MEIRIKAEDTKQVEALKAVCDGFGLECELTEEELTYYIVYLSRDEFRIWKNLTEGTTNLISEALEYNYLPRSAKEADVFLIEAEKLKEFAGTNDTLPMHTKTIKFLVANDCKEEIIRKAS